LSWKGRKQANKKVLISGRIPLKAEPV